MIALAEKETQRHLREILEDDTRKVVEEISEVEPTHQLNTTKYIGGGVAIAHTQSSFGILFSKN